MERLRNSSDNVLANSLVGEPGEPGQPGIGERGGRGGRGGRGVTVTTPSLWRRLIDFLTCLFCCCRNLNSYSVRSLPDNQSAIVPSNANMRPVDGSLTLEEVEEVLRSSSINDDEFKNRVKQQLVIFNNLVHSFFRPTIEQLGYEQAVSSFTDRSFDYDSRNFWGMLVDKLAEFLQKKQGGTLNAEEIYNILDRECNGKGTIRIKGMYHEYQGTDNELNVMRAAVIDNVMNFLLVVYYVGEKLETLGVANNTVYRELLMEISADDEIPPELKIQDETHLDYLLNRWQDELQALSNLLGIAGVENGVMLSDTASVSTYHDY